MVIAATGCAILDEPAIEWLFEHPGELLGTPSGEPLAIAMPNGAADEARRMLEHGGRATPSGRPTFVRKLRRKVNMLAISIADGKTAQAEWRLFVNAYKGVTDLITKYVWPRPAFYVTRLCARLHISPNMVTVTGMLLMFVAAWFFWQGQFAAGLGAAWVMTFFDTVDGKLARVTAQSSRLGDKLDHGTDMLHPPLWWWAVTRGIDQTDGTNDELLWTCFGVIFVCYILSRSVEEGFKKRFGFNAYMWRPFDSAFRLVIARRNIILLMLTIGLAVGALTESWIAVALWSVASLVVQIARLLMAERADHEETVRPWLA